MRVVDERQCAGRSARASGAAASAASGATFDHAWVKRITAPHKGVFDSPDVNDGLAFGQAALYVRGYRDVYGSDSDVQPVIVMRHKGVVLAFGDALWDKYEIGKAIQLKDAATGTWARRNPFYKADPRDKAAAPEMTLDGLAAHGAVLVACNLAAMGYAGRLAAKTHADVDAVRDEVRAGLVPGVTLAPSGVYAVMRAQEAGCVFMRSA